MKPSLRERWDDIQLYLGQRNILRILLLILGFWFVITVVLGLYWSIEPDLFSVEERAQAELERVGGKPAPGHATTSAAIGIMDTLLNKPGGYLTNDVMPPGAWIDNMPRWEFGVLVQIRDLARAMRKDISRSQSQSSEDRDLVIAEPQFNMDSRNWMFPRAEDEYANGVKALRRYLARLSTSGTGSAQFYARADNLRNWLTDVETRLGSLAQRLSESVGKTQYDTALAGQRAVARQGAANQEHVKTPWLKIDDVFFEARGTTWALIHILRAIQIDFKDVLDDKNAEVSLNQIIADLEATQDTIWSPLILNGSGFGMLANHSLTMASYISRVNAAVIDLRLLLAQG